MPRRECDAFPALGDSVSLRLSALQALPPRLDGQQRSLDLGSRVIARQRAMDATGEAFSHDGHHRMTAWWQGVLGALSWTGASDPATWTEVERYTLDAVLARQQTERQSFGGSPVATAYAQNAAHFTTQVGAESRTVHEGFLNGDGTFYYRWDAWGRLTEVREAATGLVRRAHIYDAEGRRVLETEVEGGSSKTTRYVFWGRGLAASYDLAGGNTRTYGFVGGADGEAFVRVQQGGGDDLFELARDFQGSVLALIQRTNPTSVGVVERYRYEPFGKVAIEDGSGQPLPVSAFGNERFFLGRIWDEQIGIYDVRARWYEPDVGAFLAPDPLGAIDSWNLYQYGVGVPQRYADPWGLGVWDYVKGIAAGLGIGAWDLAKSVVGTGWDIVRHPIRTSNEIADGFGELKDALLDGDWEALAEVLSPELVELAKNWENLSDFDRGKLIGRVAAEVGGVALGGSGAAKIAKQLKAARVAAAARRALAKKIASGHAFGKHVLQGCEFPGILTPQQFEDLIIDVMKKGERKTGRNGRAAYYDRERNVLVIEDPGHADGGTAFSPGENAAKGAQYFDEWD